MKNARDKSAPKRKLSKIPELNRDDFVHQYAQIKELYANFAKAVESIVYQLAIHNGYKVQSVSSRSKDIDKLSEKIDRKASRENKNYASLSDIEDLAGVRIIFYLEDDRKKFINAVCENFGAKSVRVEDKDEPSGYRATHIILRLNPERLGMPEYASYKGLKCELQITSALYHVWSEIEHDIIYKPAGDKEELDRLGLADLERSFQKTMDEHIRAASEQFNFISKRYKEIAEAGKLLSPDVIGDIRKAESNDKIEAVLEVLAKFAHKKPDLAFDVINLILRKRPLLPKAVAKFGDQEILGKTHENVEIKAMEMLNAIRYHKFDDVLRLASELIRKKTGAVKDAAKNIVAEGAKYNYNFISQVKNYGPQGRMLKFMESWSQGEQLKNLEFIEVASQELLGLDIEGTSYPSEDQITFHRGAIQSTDFIKKLRRKVISIVVKLYDHVDDANKLRLAKVLEAATQLPMHSNYEDDLRKMVLDDHDYLLGVYRKFLFPEGRNLSGSLAVAEEIESRLYWLMKSADFKTEAAVKLRSDIISDKDYNFFRLLAGDEITFRDDNNWEEARKERMALIDAELKKVHKANIQIWIDKLNRVAAQAGLVERWQFQYLEIFLRNLASSKPDLANMILIDAVRGNKPISQFIASILIGFRFGNYVQEWDASVKFLIKRKNYKLVTAIAYSLAQDGVGVRVRDADVKLLESLSGFRGDFQFLSKWRSNVEVDHAVMCALLNLFSQKPEIMEKRLVEMLKKTPGLRKNQIQRVSFAIARGQIDPTQFSDTTVGFIKEWLIELADLEYDAQEILVALSRRDPRTPFDVMWGRLQYEASEKIAKNRWISGKYYDAIPHHFNPSLIDLIKNNQDSSKYMQLWFDQLPDKYSILYWGVSRLLTALGDFGKSLIQTLIEKGGVLGIKKSVRLLDKFERVDSDLPMKIIEHTDDKKVISEVAATLSSTGVVSGEDGIARAYESRAEGLKKYLKSKSKKVRTFARIMINNLTENARRERSRVADDKLKRRVEFEG